jgi:putative transposase
VQPLSFTKGPRHKFTNILTPAQVYRFAVDFCQPHLRFRAVGPVTAVVLLTVLFAATARMSSISATCRRLNNAPCEATFTAALSPQVLDLDELRHRINAACADPLPRALRRRRKRPSPWPST